MALRVAAESDVPPELLGAVPEPITKKRAGVWPRRAASPMDYRFDNSANCVNNVVTQHI